MVQTFYHGSETPIATGGTRPVRETEIGVIGLIGTAPMHLVDEADRSLNAPVQVLNRRQAAQSFGEHRIGYTIPAALDAIFDQVGSQGGVKVLVVNVLDAFGDQATTTIAEAELTFDGDVLQLPKALTNVTITDDTLPTTTYIADTDYTLDAASGTITRIGGGGITANQTVFVTYSHSSGAHKTSLTDVSKTFPSSGVNTDLIQLEEGLSGVVVTNTGGSTTYVLDTDYTLDATAGQIRRLATGSIAAGATVEIDYTFADPSIVQNSDIIGQVTQAGDREGLKAFKDAYNLFGFFPKILIAPGFSPINAITSEMDVVATDIDCMAIVDAPLGTAYNDVITGRGPQGNINFNYSSDRLVGCYPHLKVYDLQLEAEATEPFSQRLAGIWANRMVERGFWWSPSNAEIQGITGFERLLEFIPGRADTEANTLNANGIVTYANYFGSGIRTWGNRSFAYPTSTALGNFINVRMSQIVINERLRELGMQYVDQPITNGLIDDIIESVSAYFRRLIRQQALVGATITYDPANNPADQLATGQVVFDVDLAPPPPAERLTFRSFLNIALLDNLNVGREPVGV